MKENFFTASRVSAFAVFAAFAVLLFAAPAQSADNDQGAKQAVPASGKALLYIYRKQDDGGPTTVVKLNGSEVARLDPQTFGLWNVDPGRIEIRADSKVIALQCEPGRIYFVEVVRTTVAGVNLRQVSYAVGRTQTHQARLAGSAPSAAAAKPSAPPAPARPQAGATPRAPSRASTPAAQAASADSRPPRDRFVLILQTGSFSLANGSQTIIFDQEFDTASSSPLAIEGEVFINDNFAVSGEFFQYSNSFARANDRTITSKAATSVYTLNAKYFFRTGDDFWRPYIGAGAGAASVKFSGDLSGDSGGLATQLFAGVQWRWQAIGVRAEYKVLNATAKSDVSGGGTAKTNVSGNGLLLGVSFHF